MFTFGHKTFKCFGILLHSRSYLKGKRLIDVVDDDDDDVTASIII